MLVFGALLGLENFSRQMKIGTYVIFVATILLTVVGPGIQDDQVIGELLRQPVASVWFSLLLLGMIVSTALMVSKTFEERKQIAVLLVARSTSYTLNLTVSRAFLLNPTMLVLTIFIVIKLVSGSIYTYAIVVQSTTVTQSKIVPLVREGDSRTQSTILKSHRLMSLPERNDGDAGQCHNRYTDMAGLEGGRFVDWLHLRLFTACTRVRSAPIFGTADDE